MQRSSAIAPPEQAGLHPPRPRPRPPVVERIAGWSARHRKTAVLGWLFLVAAVFVGGQMLPAKNVQNYDAGQSGQAERTLNRLNVPSSPPAENVLIQARAPGRTFAADPEMRQATQQVAVALRGLPRSAADIRSPLSSGAASLVSANGRSALVRFSIPGNSGN
jgi:RND superfamily putative drug exporter